MPRNRKDEPDVLLSRLGVSRAQQPAVDAYFHVVCVETVRRVGLREVRPWRKFWTNSCNSSSRPLPPSSDFVGLVWAWSLDQINKMAQVPLENWPLWKQILLALVAAAVGYALFVAAWRLWIASIRAVTAFASFVAALIVALPPILIAGVIALAGLWVINNVSSLPLLSGPERSNSSAANDTGKQRPAGSSASETTGGRQ